METPTLQGPVDDKWIKLVRKIGQHPKGKNLILLPEEAILLRKKMGELTKQLFQLAGFVQKYQPILETMAKAEASVKQSEDQGEDHAASEDRSDRNLEGARGGDGVDPEDLHNTPTPEPVYPVATFGGQRPAFAILDEVNGG